MTPANLQRQARRIIKRIVIGLYCRGWLSFRATEWVFRHIDVKGV